MNTVIRVSGLGKEYIIGGREKGNETFREMLTGSLLAPFRRLRKLKGEVAEEERFWALKDVSFEVQRGEVVGIIGRNGAGKSTLLKILSRITDPTEGEVEIRGRVASLLEVGTGFHPELTGRENIYLNGAILGMSRAEIARKFDEIVAFAEVEKFLDTPVKRYSSGMYVRLAFAVAAHLEPEILIVDEVLAVGDNEFQAKCIRKMDDISGQGRTILLVSHNMGSINRLCSRALLLDSGRLQIKGDPNKVIGHYYAAVTAGQGKWQQIPADSKSQLQFVSAEGEAGQVDGAVPYDQKIKIKISYNGLDAKHYQLMVRIKLEDSHGNHILTSIDTDSLADRTTGIGAVYEEVCEIPARLLRPGLYTAFVLLERIVVRTVEYRETAQVSFRVTAVGWNFESTRRGLITPVLKWSISSCAK